MLLITKLKNYKIIVASASPRRRQLIVDAGIDYSLAPSYDVEEIYPEKIAREDIPVYLSELKSSAYPLKLSDNEILITADTIVLINGKVLGKPRDRAEAILMLTTLSGNKHHVITGVTLRSSEKMISFSEKTTVNFRQLTPEEIEYYVDNFKPFDKAGAYGIQEWIGYIGVESIEGSFYNVMGLPIQKLYTNLDKFTK